MPKGMAVSLLEEKGYERLGFGGARTRTGIYSEHAAAEKAEGRYPPLRQLFSLKF